MGKYDAPLDADGRNSLSMILARVRRGSRVLEFGPANGRMTRYMKETLGCTVDIVEIDEESGRDAAHYAETACLGSEEGDIERDLWEQKLADRAYDHILFADVLEHLYHPARALRRAMDHLKEDGTIITSLPNIANNALLVGLFAGRFTYTPTGLLDDTHIRFFTYDSFLELARTVGLQAVYAGGTVTRVGATEVPVSYDMVSRSVRRELAARERGDVYQYVFELRRAVTDTIRPLVTDFPAFGSSVCECYLLGAEDADFSDAHCRRQFFAAHDGAGCTFRFELGTEVRALRLDPIDTDAIVQDVAIQLIAEDGTAEDIDLGTCEMNAVRAGSLLVFDTPDPQIIVRLSEPRALRSVTLRYALVLADDDAIHPMAAAIAALARDRDARAHHDDEAMALLAREREGWAREQARLEAEIERLRRSPLQRVRDKISTHDRKDDDK
ncbi:class I SAM-dependent methyltransferase [uncultured Selenomonas sp.]|uniref:class I SAM-dependent methyltransferase n=1 Tax=uncultured Selenomonas sp. TaxID=159275 RepID=UPI0025F92B12|nr:class I SAM-dependent methyltransferase [uncultured Selenomonas sp.]